MTLIPLLGRLKIHASLGSQYFFECDIEEFIWIYIVNCLKIFDFGVVPNSNRRFLNFVRKCRL